MTVTKLDCTHIDGVKHLFYNNEKYMGSDIFFKREGFSERMYDMFCETYLANLTRHHAYGIVNNGQVDALISFYESSHDPSWYLTFARGSGDSTLFKDILDKVIDHNEKQGRLKFFSLVNAKYAHPKLWRKLMYSKYNNERYGFFDEYCTPKDTKCFYELHWDIMYRHFALPVDSVMRCTFLKQEYRDSLPKGGNI